MAIIGLLNLFSYFRPIKKPMPATLTYSPPTSQNPMEILRADTRDTRRPMNPLTGICPTHRTPRGYRHASPHGAGLPSGIEGRRSDAARPTANYSLLTANSSFASGNGTHAHYTYDSVSNITSITNSAAMLPNGLGGAYSSSYDFDNSLTYIIHTS